MGLTRKQRIFVSEYLQCWNSAEAARRAGYSEKTARMIGQENLTKPYIAAVIRAEIEARSVKVPEALEILGGHARSNLAPFFEIQERETDTPLPGEKIIDEQEKLDAKGNTIKVYTVQRIVIDMVQILDPEKAKLIKKFTSSPRNGVSIELYDAQAATAKLLEASGVFRQTNLNIDISGLTTEQLERIARGENPIDVVAASAGACGTRAATPEAAAGIEDDPAE